MKHFQYRFSVQAPIELVASFHNDPSALKHLMPFPIILIENKSEPISEGSIVDMTIWLGLLPIRWISVHSNVHPTNGFTDTQIRGPFKTWIHQHRFESLSEKTTVVIDEIDAQYSSHPIWGIISRLMWLGLPTLFSFRARQTKRAIEG
ncbi:MAG: hypothetical protein GTO18_05510 [Anaerolineales bacterium]|nr:hypothetical protein [Anaerolineales bacterium]